VRYLVDILTQSLFALKDNQLRTFLSILGIAIGIAAVMSVGTVSNGGHQLVFNELETFGLKTVWVFRDNNDRDPRRIVRKGTGIENDDLEAIRNAPRSLLRRITPLVFLREKPLVRACNRYNNGQVLGVGSEYIEINNDTLVHGRFLSPVDVQRNRNVAVIASEAQNNLFGKEVNPTGRELIVGRNRFTVIGVLAAKSRDFLSSIGSIGGQNDNARVLIPYTVMQQIQGSKEINVLQGETRDVSGTGAAVVQLSNILKRRHGEKFDYKVQTMVQ